MKPLSCFFWAAAAYLTFAAPLRADAVREPGAPVVHDATLHDPDGDRALFEGYQAVTLDQVLGMLRERSPRVATQRSQIDAAKAEVAGAGVYPNPTLSYSIVAGIQGVEYVNGTQQEIEIEQPFLIAGQRGARQAAASASVNSATARAKADYQDTAHQAGELFASLLAAEERVHVLNDTRTDFDAAKRIVEGRTQSGMMSSYDSVRIEVETHSLEARLAAARADFDDASTRLAALIGLPDFRPRANGDLRSASRETTRDAPSSVENVPSVVAANKEESTAHSRVDVAKRERWPNPVVGVGAQFTTSGYTLAGTIGVSMDLPLFDRGQGSIGKAQADVMAAERARELAQADARTELSRALRAVQARDEALTNFERDVMARLPSMKQMAEDAYTNGRGTVLDLLDTLRTRVDTRMTEVDYLEAAALAHADLSAARGLADPIEKNSRPKP